MNGTKFGKCRWCERERALTFVIGQYCEELWCGWICYECLKAAQKRQEGK